MGSKKRSARAREVADFKSQLESGLGGLDDLFANEELREQKREAEHDATMRWKACEKKNRYATRDDAEGARDARARNLSLRVLRRMAPDIAPFRIAKTAP